jgi:hypothetical protein
MLSKIPDDAHPRARFGCVILSVLTEILSPAFTGTVKSWTGQYSGGRQAAFQQMPMSIKVRAVWTSWTGLSFLEKRIGV